MKKYLVFALSICLLSACNSGDNELIPEETDPVAITLSAKSLAIGVETKAPYMDTTPGTTANLTARVVSSATSLEYKSLYSNGKMIFISSEGTPTAVGYETTPSTTTYYPGSNSAIYFSGFHPYDTWTLPASDASGDAVKKASFTFTGKEDVMYAWQVSNTKDAALGGTVPNLEFNHLLTLLNVSVKADTDGKAAWGNITGIDLIKAGGAAVEPLNTVTVTMATKPAEGTPIPAVVPSKSGSTTVVIPFYHTGTDVAVSEVETGGDGDKVITLGTNFPDSPNAYAMVAPITATGTADFTLKIYSSTYTGGREVKINLRQKDAPSTEFTGSTQGKSFEIALTFQATGITATATVAEWVASGGAAVDVE
ncbi:hypothetical protein M2137_002372 [Parabacteroides sp. PFB2-10]|uniref:fimbrillin family protein n=1 Tax=Parabacteroides sp. PFB2-10 TaxID=1742405 RepID=UPI002476B0DD|nr:fimbrillin family protein [Parabacteroides sp. PFB2-10]MDH6313582.1 hypothetical protein [Parabacteroides sp. PFB2-10]MDL2245293.1 fimbrillin family protein [Parabacteroides sp. OttesenSCG-928-J18]